MSKMFFQMMVSLDGFIAGPNGELDWHHVDADFTRYVDTMLRSIDTILLGRVTYQELSSYWPTASEPEAQLMNELRKVVVSRTLRTTAWSNAELAEPGDLREVITGIKQRSSRGVALFGSSTLASHCMELGLIDEYRFIVSPVVLGAGKRLFTDVATRHPLQLRKAEQLSSGTMCLYYAPV